MYHYGQAITFGPLTAPQLFTGDIVRYSIRDAETDEDLTNASDAITALAFHSRQAEINFESEITKGSTDFLDLSTGAAIAIGGIDTGLVLVSEVVERWALGRKKTASIRATWFPDITHTSGGEAGDDLDAFTPDQEGLDIVFPGEEVIYGTHGLGHAAGTIHELTITQRLLITPDEPSPLGKILGAACSRYKRTISLSILALGSLPAVRSELVLTGAPAHAQKYRITSAEKAFERMKGKMYNITASWIPAFGNGGDDSGGTEE